MAPTGEVIFNFRPEYLGGAWDQPVGLGLSGFDLEVDWLAPIESYGVAYVGPPSDDRGFFVRIGGNSIFSDGFESGDTSGWSTSVF